MEMGFDSSETTYPLTQGSSERASLIGSFQTIFNEENSPYDENWDYETTDGFLEWTSQQDYEGFLALDEGKVIGFSWGYKVDPGEINVDKKFPEELQQADIDFYDGETFMIDEVGVMPGYRGQGLGKKLEENLMNTLVDRDDISRVMQRTQLSEDNQAKLNLDYQLGFNPVTYGTENEAVLQEVDFVGTSGSDERVYLWREANQKTNKEPDNDIWSDINEELGGEVIDLE